MMTTTDQGIIDTIAAHAAVSISESPEGDVIACECEGFYTRDDHAVHQFSALRVRYAIVELPKRAAMSTIPYDPPNGLLQDTVLSFSDMQMTSTWSARVEPDPLGTVNKIVSLWRGNHRVKAVLWPVPAGAAVEVVRDDGGYTIDALSELMGRFWDSRGTNKPPPEIHTRPRGWRIQVNGHTALAVTDAELHPPTPPLPKVPLRQRIHRALRQRARAGVDVVAGKFGYHREHEEDW